MSKTEDFNVLQQKIDRIVEISKRFGEQRGSQVAEDDQLRVLFVDDWVVGGGSKAIAQRLMKKHNALTSFAVMYGDNADVTGSRDSSKGVSWH